MSKPFEPKKFKYKKTFRARVNLQIDKNLGDNLSYNTVCLQVKSPGRISSSQFSAIKQSINKRIKKKGKCRFFAFPNLSTTIKKGGGRMGKGKGAQKVWVSSVRPGFILCEITTSLKNVGITALETAQYRLPVRTNIIIR